MVTLPAKLEIPVTANTELPVLLVIELPPLMVNAPRVSDFCKSKIEVPAKVNELEVAPKVPAPLTEILPSAILVPPVYVLAPVKFKFPVPCLVKAMVPATMPDTVLVPTLLVKIVKLPGLEIAPELKLLVPELIVKLVLY